MVYHNRSNAEFQVFGYPGADIFTRPDADDIGRVEGLYYRTQSFAGLEAELQRCRSGEMAYTDLSLDADQAWNESAWKLPHASLEAAKRYGAKFREEVREVDDALEEYWDTRNPAHFIEELGDLKWVLLALASNSGVVISDAVKSRLYQYAAGTRVFNSGGGLRYPDWYETATQLAIKQGSLSIGDIDSVIDAGLVPQHSPAMNIEEDETISPTFYVNDFILHGLLLKIEEEQYDENGFRFALVPLAEQPSAQHAAEIYLRIAAMAHYVGSTLAEVIRINVEKIAQRVATGTIDKSDGGRENL